MVILPFLTNSSKSLHTLAIRCKQLGFKVCPEQLSVKPSDWASRDQSDHMAHQAISQDLSPTGLHLCCHRASKFFRCMNMSFFFFRKKVKIGQIVSGILPFPSGSSLQPCSLFSFFHFLLPTFPSESDLWAIFKYYLTWTTYDPLQGSVIMSSCPRWHWSPKCHTVGKKLSEDPTRSISLQGSHHALPLLKWLLI